MNSIPSEIVPYLERLVTQLKEKNVIRTPAVATAFAHVPRHRLLEYYFRPTERGWTQIECDANQPRPEDLEFLYSDTPVVTRVDEYQPPQHLDWSQLYPLFWDEAYPRQEATASQTQGYKMPSSSTSQPGLVANMLELLNISPGMKVLEIGAGTGYNAALMAELVGATGGVVAIDIQADVIAQTRQLLAALGYDAINLLTRDGFVGAAEEAPFDRIVATVGCPDLSPHWVDQLKADGYMLIPLQFGAWCPLVKVWRSDDRIYGQFVGSAGFMPIQGALSLNNPWLLTQVPPLPFKGFQELPAFAANSPEALAGFGDFLTMRDRRSFTNDEPPIHALYDPTRGVVGIHQQTSAILLKGDQSLYEVLHRLYDEWCAAGKPTRDDYRMEFIPLDAAPPLTSATWAIDRKFYRQLFRL